MTTENPFSKPKESFDPLMAKLQSVDSPVGIDVKYTHAIIIDYLQQISERLDQIEQKLK